MNLLDETNYVGEIGLDFTRQSHISCDKQCLHFEKKIVRACAEKNKLMCLCIFEGQKKKQYLF